jgi:hypothetical protein
MGLVAALSVGRGLGCVIEGAMVSSESFAAASAASPLSCSTVSSFPHWVVHCEDTAAETTRVSDCLQDELTIDMVELGREEAEEEEMETEEIDEGGIAPWARCAAPSTSSFTSSSCISPSGEDEDTAACESKFGCTQDVSIITESETGRGRESGVGGETEWVMDGSEEDEVDEEAEEDEEGEVRGAMWDAQLFPFLLAAWGWEAMGGDNAAGEAEFCCTQGVFFTALASDAAELEGTREGRELMGVRIRMVRWGGLWVRGVGEKVELGRGEDGERVVEEGGSVTRRRAAVVAWSRAMVRWRCVEEEGVVRSRSSTSRWMMKESEGRTSEGSLEWPWREQHDGGVYRT